jgi:hypothetical protein
MKLKIKMNDLVYESVIFILFIRIALASTTIIFKSKLKIFLFDKRETSSGGEL